MKAVGEYYLRGRNSGIHPVRQCTMLNSSSSLLGFCTTLKGVTITTAKFISITSNKYLGCFVFLYVYRQANMSTKKLC